MKESKLVLLAFCLLIITVTTKSFAQEEQEEQDSEIQNAEPPPGQISDAIPYVTILAIAFAYNTFIRVKQ
jgi:hypothetical protein